MRATTKRSSCVGRVVLGRAWLASSLVSPEILSDRRADQLAEAGALVERQLPDPPMRVLVKGNGRGLHPRSLRRLGRCPPPPCPRPLPRGPRHVTILAYYGISVPPRRGARCSSHRARPAGSKRTERPTRRAKGSRLACRWSQSTVNLSRMAASRTSSSPSQAPPGLAAARLQAVRLRAAARPCRAAR